MIRKECISIHVISKNYVKKYSLEEKLTLNEEEAETICVYVIGWFRVQFG
jgi:hypothetical protein